MARKPEADATLDRVAGTQFDVLVIGAGIVGSRIAYEAANAGLSVALVDAGDFGGCTSSATSKLLHGGLRYLATGDVRLVRELQSERRILANRIAPHLAESLPLVLAVEGRSPLRAAKLDVALPLYAALSAFRRPWPRRLSVEAATKLIGPLRSDSVSACGVVAETLVHDARLTLATVRAAVRAGAVAAGYVRVTSLEHGSGHTGVAVLEDVLGREHLRVQFRAVVNAAGPSVDVVRALEDPRAAPLMRLSKGVHVLVPADGAWRGGLALFDDAGTAVALPWQGMLLLGSTDTPYDGDPAHLAVHAADVDQVLNRFAGLLPDALLHPSRVVHAFAGLRVLPLGNVSTARAQRRHVISLGRRGMVSVAGGKLTSHRLIAMDALRSLPAQVRPRRASPLTLPLGRTCTDAVRARLNAQLDTDVVDHLCRLYGMDAVRVAACGSANQSALERVDPRGPDIWAQVDYAVDDEYALTADDVLARRTTLAVRGLASRPLAEAVRERLAERTRARRITAVVP